MQELQDKSIKKYDYTSRYNSVPYYYNYVDKKYVYGLSYQLRNDTGYSLHTVKLGDTLDSLSLKYYGRPDLFWVIADYNRILDSFTNIYNNFYTIKIPNLGDIKWQT